MPGKQRERGKKKSGRIRHGNPSVRRILCEAAHSAVKTRCQFKGQFEGLAIRRGKKRAIVAVAHRMLEVVFVILKTGQPYRDPGIDYEKLLVERNAPRWIKTLQKYGYYPKAQASAPSGNERHRCNVASQGTTEAQNL